VTKILIIDGQGGKIGRQLIEKLRQLPDVHITAVGTNAIATANMMKSAPDEAATGENSIITCARRVHIICGPLGIVIADAMNGEISAAAAIAVGRSDAVRILLPLNRCDTLVAGVDGVSMNNMIEEAARLCKAHLRQP